MTLGEKIKQARKNAGLTQKQLGETIGAAAVTIRQYEAGNREPSLAILGKIAKALNTTVYELIGDDWSGIDMSDAWGEYSTEQKSPAPTNEGGTKVNPRYFNLSDEARAAVDALIDQLAKGGQ